MTLQLAWSQWPKMPWDCTVQQWPPSCDGTTPNPIPIFPSWSGFTGAPLCALENQQQKHVLSIIFQTYCICHRNSQGRKARNYSSTAETTAVVCQRSTAPRHYRKRRWIQRKNDGQPNTHSILSRSALDVDPILQSNAKSRAFQKLSLEFGMELYQGHPGPRKGWTDGSNVFKVQVLAHKLLQE